MRLKQQGFTLIELVIVIIVLAAISIATSSYIATGVSIYTDISERDKELNSTRFVMERLRRDILNALPNSFIVSNNNQCLTFTPIKESTIYGYDFPIAPLSKSSGTIATIENYTFSTGDKAVVYLLMESELSSTKAHFIDNVTGEQITFIGAASFPLNSPSKRLYIINRSKSYYFNAADELRLADSCTSSSSSSSLMANNIKGSFEVAKPTLQRNGLAKVTFMLNFDGQDVPIEQTLHVNNVP
ncbi:PulJ/GspJ family protein [Psychromonas hadalis]|uniref:PulJ/GspJ family protein n=1 Tax=Psychromonas hadalis TaxID=211669 RepID=UPI0003B48EBE|nr:type II secretion system protein [Psychromonas hadalis]